MTPFPCRDQTRRNQTFQHNSADVPAGPARPRPSIITNQAPWTKGKQVYKRNREKSNSSKHFRIVSAHAGSAAGPCLVPPRYYKLQFLTTFFFLLLLLLWFGLGGCFFFRFTTLCDLREFAAFYYWHPAAQYSQLITLAISSSNPL